ncbi:MAG: hypothetical protein BZY88_08660 [SAR202 cluster bacterium Io17-Chloro-G9]|nr:MAG: hypothetical protein BZY88_08660 [SAR202 cluster bacterium Io17-Chloro-G9]
MTQTATYTMEAFVGDVKEIFASSRDALVQAQAVSERMKELLAVPGWLEEKINLPEEGGFGRYDLHIDDSEGHPNAGFYLMVTIQKPGQTQLPHDHGVAWVAYGIYKGSIKQTKFRWAFPGEGVDTPWIQESGNFTQTDGSVAVFLPGEIHQTLNVTDGDRALVVRLESQKLDTTTRYQYDPKDHSVKVMDR